MEKKTIQKIADYIVDTTCLHTLSGNYYTYFAEVEEKFEIKITPELAEEIQEAILCDIRIAECNIDEDAFDVLAWLSYCPFYWDDEDEDFIEWAEEQPQKYDDNTSYRIWYKPSYESEPKSFEAFGNIVALQAEETFKATESYIRTEEI